MMTMLAGARGDGGWKNLLSELWCGEVKSKMDHPPLPKKGSNMFKAFAVACLSCQRQQEYVTSVHTYIHMYSPHPDPSLA